MTARSATQTIETFPWHRFVEGPTECWLWTGHISSAGYGRISGAAYTHRVTYELLRAEIPDGLQLDHLCRNRRCGNPWHLEPVTPRVNNLRGAGPAAACAAQTQCQRGHVFDDANIYWTPNGRRQCRTCKHKRDAARWVKNAA